MNILIIGSGGREHAIAWKIKQSNKVDKIFCAPGNAGISQIAECIDINATDFESLIKLVKQANIDYTIVGPDEPLVLGIVDAFEKEGLMIFGPKKAAAILEGSKTFSKDLMKKYNIPTANYETFTTYEAAIEYIKTQKLPIVIKADGLALGKGVVICNDYKECEKALSDIMIDKVFGQSGNKVVIEEHLSGPEVSVLAFCDGKTIVPMVSAMDHKKALDGDQGLNTGGMGTVSPNPHYSQKLANKCLNEIFIPTVEALKSEGIEFKGIIFFGLMITEDGVKVIEYNARFGDPETQVVLPRLETDLLDIMLACNNGTLRDIEIKWNNKESACVILASGGYPEKYKKGYIIKGLDSIIEDDIYIFHAGTALVNNNYVTNGGRVVGISAIGNSLDNVLNKVYKNIDKIDFNDKYYRKDIGKR